MHGPAPSPPRSWATPTLECEARDSLPNRWDPCPSPRDTMAHSPPDPGEQSGCRDPGAPQNAPGEAETVRSGRAGWSGRSRAPVSGTARGSGHGHGQEAPPHRGAWSPGGGLGDKTAAGSPAEAGASTLGDLSRAGGNQRARSLSRRGRDRGRRLPGAGGSGTSGVALAHWAPDACAHEDGASGCAHTPGPEGPPASRARGLTHAGPAVLAQHVRVCALAPEAAPRVLAPRRRVAGGVGRALVDVCADSARQARRAPAARASLGQGGPFPPRRKGAVAPVVAGCLPAPLLRPLLPGHSGPRGPPASPRFPAAPWARDPSGPDADPRTRPAASCRLRPPSYRKPSRGRRELGAFCVARLLSRADPKARGTRAAQDSVPCPPSRRERLGPQPLPAALRGVVHTWPPNAPSTQAKGRSRREGPGAPSARGGDELTGLGADPRWGICLGSRETLALGRVWLLSLPCLSPVQPAAVTDPSPPTKVSTWGRGRLRKPRLLPMPRRPPGRPCPEPPLVGGTALNHI